jgi:hypothetical protein
VSRLYRDRPPELAPEGENLLGIGDGFGEPWHARHAGGLGCPARTDLVSHHLDGLWRWTDEGDPAGGDLTGELSVLGEEAVTGMHRVCAASGDRVE